MDVGLELRQARERRGLSSLQLSKIIKISLRVLDAIEAVDETRLPAPVFTRSFVKTYAAEVGLNPDDTLRRYLEQFEPAETSSVEAPREPETGVTRETRPWAPARVLTGRFGTPLLLLLVSITAVALLVRNHRQTQSNETRPGPAPVGATAALAPATSAPPQPVGTSGAVPAALDALQLTIAPTGPCWVQATVNGERVFAAELQAGDRRTVDSASDITLRVGDAATFAFAINGKRARVPGGPGQAVTVRVTKDNYPQFLARNEGT